MPVTNLVAYLSNHSTLVMSATRFDVQADISYSRCGRSKAPHSGMKTDFERSWKECTAALIHIPEIYVGFSSGIPNVLQFKLSQDQRPHKWVILIHPMCTFFSRSFCICICLKQRPLLLQQDALSCSFSFCFLCRTFPPPDTCTWPHAGVAFGGRGDLLKE